MTPSALATRGRNRANRRLRLLPHVDDRAFLPAALEIIETPASPAAVATVVVIASLVVVALAASWFGRIDVYATARGKVEPAGHAKVVEPLEAGKIASIDVRDGQRVKAGEVVLVLDSSDAGAELDSDLQAAEAARAEALRRAAAVAAARGAPSEIPWPEGVPETLRLREEGVLAADREELAATLANLDSQKLEKEAAVAQLETSMTAQKRLIETLEERVSLYQALIDKSVGTRTSLLDAVQQLRAAEAQVAGDQGRRDQARAAVASLATERSRTIETFLSDNTRKMADAYRRADEKQADAAKARVRIDRATLRAPVDGVAQAVVATTLGQVVTPGEELMHIVPVGAPVEIQAYVTNDDIGFVAAGQKAVLKIDSFPFSQYGTLGATVEDVANDAIPADAANRALSDPVKGGAGGQSLTQTAAPTTDLVFAARLEPDAYALDVKGRAVALSPGMTVTVEIQTGSRRILEYLFSPLIDVAGRAMRER
jgi:hemolysin D